MLVQTLAIKSRLNLLPLKFHRLAIEKGAVCLGISVSSSAGPAEGEVIGKLVTREQNKFLHQPKPDKVLLNRLHRLQQTICILNIQV